MQQYLNLLREVLIKGEEKSDRTGTGTLSMFGAQMRFDLRDGFPLVTTKKVHFKSVVHELLWFLRGDTNVKYLNDNGVTIWNAWANEHGELGPIYSTQWRRWQDANGLPIDQIAEVIREIRINPDSRRHIVSAWNVADLPYMVLPPCHCLFQFYVVNGRLSCQLYQRSADLFIGLPFNIASYALLTHMVAQVCDLEVGDFIWTGGDCHIYKNHVDQVLTQIERGPYNHPQLLLDRSITDIDDFRAEHIALVNYRHHPAIKGDVAV